MRISGIFYTARRLIMDKIAEKLFTYMHVNGITQRDAATMLGVDRNTLTNWRNGGVVGAKSVRAIQELTRDFVKEQHETSIGKIDEVTACLLKTIIQLPLVDRCRLLAIADDMKNGANSSAIPKKILHCPACGVDLPDTWKVGDKHECPKCGQHIKLVP